VDSIRGIRVDADDLSARIHIPGGRGSAARHGEWRKQAILDDVPFPPSSHHIGEKANDSPPIRSGAIVHGRKFVDFRVLTIRLDQDTPHGHHQVEVVTAAEDCPVGEDALGDRVGMVRIIDLCKNAVGR